jgi:hypothetical protein
MIYCQHMEGVGILRAVRQFPARNLVYREAMLRFRHEAAQAGIMPPL